MRILESLLTVAVLQDAAKHNQVRKAQKLWKKGGAAAIVVASHKHLRSTSVKVLEVEEETVR